MKAEIKTGKPSSFPQSKLTHGYIYSWSGSSLLCNLVHSQWYRFWEKKMIYFFNSCWLLSQELTGYDSRHYCSMKTQGKQFAWCAEHLRSLLWIFSVPARMDWEANNRLFYDYFLAQNVENFLWELVCAQSQRRELFSFFRKTDPAYGVHQSHVCLLSF